MSTFARRMFGFVNVREEDGVVYVEGVNARIMHDNIDNLWRTSRVCANAFLHKDLSSFSFPSFYALDICYSFERMLAQPEAFSGVRTISKIVEGLLQNTWLKKTRQPHHDRLDYSRLKLLNVTLRDYQSDLLVNYAKNTDLYDLKGYLFGAAPGTGKTITSIALHLCLKNDLAIVTVPQVAIEDVWVQTLTGIFKRPVKVWTSHMTEEPKGDEDVIVIHYEFLKKLLEMIYKFRHRKVTNILDESHNFNTIGTLRSDLYVDLTSQSNCKDVLWLSGTPIKALPIEAAPLIRCIDPKFTDDCYNRFKRIYAGATNQALEILQHRLGIISMYVKKDVLNLAPPIFQDVKVVLKNARDYTLPAIRQAMIEFTQKQEIYYASRRKEDEEFFYGILNTYAATLKSAAQKSEYQAYRRSLDIVIRSSGSAIASDEIRACNEFETRCIMPILNYEERKMFKDVRSVIKYVKLKIQGECLGRVVGGLRIQCAVDMAKVFDFQSICETTTKKTVVFTSYVQVLLEGLQNVKNNTDYTPLSAYAENSGKLHETVKEFYDNENANPLFATYKTLSTAVPLTAADVAVIFDAPFRDYTLQQAIARIHRDDSRPGHKITQVYVYLVSLDTGEEINISSRSFDILKWSQEQVQAITGVQSPFDITTLQSQNDPAMESLGWYHDFQNHWETSKEVEPFTVTMGQTPKALMW